MFSCDCYLVVEYYGSFFSVVGGALSDIPSMVFQKYACCACDPSVYLNVHCLCFCISEFIFSC